MNKTGILLQGNDLFLSYKFLRSHGISTKTIDSWKQRGLGITERVDIESYILYKTIPLRSRKKLPSEQSIRSTQKEDARSQTFNTVFKILERAFYLDHSKYQSLYETDSPLASEKVIEFAQLHAVLQSIIDLKQRENLKDLRILHEAFNNLFPGKYSCKNALSNAIRKAMCDGIMSVALDKRAFGNNQEQNSKKFTSLQKFWMSSLAGSPAKYSNSKIHEKICHACEETGQHKPSLSWVKKWRAQLLRNPELFNSRYGQQETNKVMPFASLNHASRPNDQWQMDGWTLPFWGRGEKGFKRYVLVRLIDNNSKKVVGYSFGESEDSALIMEAIRDAINNAGVLPFEVLTDNHSFNQTQEAKNLIELFRKKGARWTVSQNPQHKAIIERYNQHLDNFCREHYGYLGQGIRSKSIEALAKPELIDQYTKNFLSTEEIRGIAISVVERYNNTPLKCGKTPNELHNENVNPYPIEVNVFDRAELLSMQAEKKVSRGQITIMRGAVKHEFQFPAEYFQDVNNKTVVIRYESLADGIYVFDKKTTEPIAFLPPKEKINGAIINQTDKDIDALNRHKGRITGIRTQARKQLENLSKAAHEIDPEAYARINKLTTPKNVLTELEQDSHLRQIAIDKGLKMDLLHVPEREFTTGTTALQPKSKVNDKPLKAKNNSIGMVNLNEDFDND